jgi:hypothetical protein
MSGAVPVLKDVAKTVVSPMTLPIQTAIGVAKGKGIGRSFMESDFGEAANFVVGGKKEELPNIAVQDPSVIEEANKKERERVRRQAQIDIMTDKPGRGGTILTDKYTYNV